MYIVSTGANSFALSPVAQLYGKIIAERDRRLAEGETPDPLCAMAARIETDMEPSLAECQFVWECHHEGPWRIRTAEELILFTTLAAEAGVPLKHSAVTECYAGSSPEGSLFVRLYLDDFGDCVLTEASRGSRFAIWTRKGRIQIGFRDTADAITFRAKRPNYSMEATGNRHTGLIVLEGWADDTDLLAMVIRDLADFI
jgi:hypothetical protein